MTAVGQAVGRIEGVGYAAPVSFAQASAGARPARFNLTTLEPMLEDLHARLAGVVIECLDFGQFITRYDGAGTLFYLDPPYWGCEGDYGRALFSRDRFEEMARLLRGLEGRFILSLNDLPEVRETFAGFHIAAVRTTYTIAAKGAQTERGEVLISNHALPGAGA